MQEDERLENYRLISRLAHGAMGEVWEAECTEARAGLKPGDRVALKLVPEFLLHDTMLIERLKREAEAISRLKHPGIVAFHELGEADGRVFMVLELLRGETLAERLAKEKQLPITEIERIGGAIAGALAYIHGKGIYHRDLKPQNIFLTEDGAVKLIDLGVAKVLDEASLTMTGSHFGTPAYMSPESFRDSKSVTGAADVWSLGVILYEMATGQLPFPGNSAAAIIAKISDTNITPQSPARLRPDLPEKLAQVIGRCIERDSRRRLIARAVASTWKNPATGSPTRAWNLPRLPDWLMRWLVNNRRTIVFVIVLLATALAARNWTLWAWFIFVLEIFAGLLLWSLAAVRRLRAGSTLSILRQVGLVAVLFCSAGGLLTTLVVSVLSGGAYVWQDELIAWAEKLVQPQALVLRDGESAILSFATAMTDSPGTTGAVRDFRNNRHILKLRDEEFNLTVEDDGGEAIRLIIRQLNGNRPGREDSWVAVPRRDARDNRVVFDRVAIGFFERAFRIEFSWFGNVPLRNGDLVVTPLWYWTAQPQVESRQLSLLVYDSNVDGRPGPGDRWYVRTDTEPALNPLLNAIDFAEPFVETDRQLTISIGPGGSMPKAILRYTKAARVPMRLAVSGDSVGLNFAVSSRPSALGLAGEFSGIPQGSALVTVWRDTTGQGNAIAGQITMNGIVERFNFAKDAESGHYHELRWDANHDGDVSNDTAIQHFLCFADEERQPADERYILTRWRELPLGGSGMFYELRLFENPSDAGIIHGYCFGWGLWSATAIFPSTRDTAAAEWEIVAVDVDADGTLSATDSWTVRPGNDRWSSFGEFRGMQTAIVVGTTSLTLTPAGNATALLVAELKP